MTTSTSVVTRPLVARDLVKAYGDHVVLDGVDVVASPGLPLGMVGENGAGKSTLLRVLAGAEPADSGTVDVPAELAYLAQEPDFRADATIAEVLADALAPLHDAVTRLEVLAGQLQEPGVAEAYATLLEWAQLHDAWDADRRAAVAAHRLGLATLDRARPVAALSGGQRARLALAALIARRPGCVLLDEPTNHLDDDAMSFLEEFLVGLPGVVVVASHDRTFLGNVCRHILDLDPAPLWSSDDPGQSNSSQPIRFTGGYEEFLIVKADARRRWEEAFENQQEELNGLREAARTTARRVAHNRPPRDNDKYIYSFKGGNVARTVSRRVRDAERRIELLEREQVPKPPKPLSFDADLATVRSTGRVVQVRDLEVPGRLFVPRLDLEAGDHLLVTGPNGSGKSTLLKALAGRLEQFSGDVSIGARRVGYLPQEVTFRDSSRTPSQWWSSLTKAADPQRSSAASSRGPRRSSPSRPLHDLGLLHPRDLNRPIGELSVGQQRRLGLALLVARQPDLLLLDEPTNHISLTLAEELEQALQRSPGTVIVATHDRWLRRRWSAQVFAL
jgi:macrolide transport system ATP-binding/permease protein